MQQNDGLGSVPLFSVFTGAELDKLAALLDITLRTYSAERIILREGDANGRIYALKSGSAYALRYDEDGREELFSIFKAGELFGDMLAVSGGKSSPVTVRARGDAKVFSFDYSRLVKPGGEESELRARLLGRLTAELAEKFFDLQARVVCLSGQTLRDKIYRFLQNEKRKHRGSSFTLELDRERLAAYLNTERSSLSRELSRMKRDGLIDFYKSSFKLH